MLKKMRKLRKKVVSLAIMVAMIVTLLPTTAFADGTGEGADPSGSSEVVKLWIKYGEEDYKITDTQWQEIVTRYEKQYYASANHRSNVANQEEYTGVALEDIFEYLELDTDCLAGEDKVIFRDYIGSQMSKMSVDQVFNTTRYAYKASVDENGEYVRNDSNEVIFLEEGAIESPIFIETNDEGENGGRLVVSMAIPGEFSKQYWWSNIFGSAESALTAATIEIPASAIKTGFESGTGTAEDPYVIATAEQLKNLADKVNAGTTYEGKYFKLANDIDLATLKDAEGNQLAWTPIGGGAALAEADTDGYDKNTPTYKFLGTFDGNGKAIKNLMIDADADFVGLFGHNGGTLKNFTLEGKVTVKGSHDYVGAVVAFNSGKIIRVINKAEIAAPDCYNVGGIAGTNVGNTGNWKYKGDSNKCTLKNAVGLITECGNEAKLTAMRTVGGIVGSNFGDISYCYNYGDIDFWWEGSMSKIGGIAGVCADTGDSTWAPGNITSCYNTGEINWINTVQSSRGYGGIVCFTGSTSYVINCYSIGDMKVGRSDYTPIVPRYDSGITINNNYTLDTVLSNHTYYDEDSANVTIWGIIKNAEWYKSAESLTALGGAYTTDTSNINNGFPVLKWQNGISTTVESLSVCDANGNAVTEATFVEGQILSSSNATVKTWSVYAVYSDGTKEMVPVNACTLGKTDAITMDDDGQSLVVSYNGKSAEIKMNVEQKVLNYIYVSTKPTKYVYESGDTFDSTGMIVRADFSNELLTGTEKYEYLNNTDYTINAPATLTETNNKITVFYTLNGKTSSVSFEVEVFDAGTAPPTDADGVYQLSTADDLLWYAKQVNYFGNISLNAVLTDNIDASNVAWMPIGSNYSKTIVQDIVAANGATGPTSNKTLTYSFSNQYKGTFDGNGKSIKLNAASDANENTTYVGAFGYTNTATIKNLTVKGTVSGSNYVAGLVAYDNDNTKIDNCVNEATVDGANYTAGILGYSKTATVTDSTNKGTITSTGTQYVAGVAAYACNIEGCVNEGNITAENVYNVGGVVGYGYKNGIITNSANLGNVQGKYSVGGIYGTGYVTKIENCYNKGNVTATALSTTKGVGGIIGTKHSSYAMDVINCYNAGTISTTGTTTALVGGLVGYADGTRDTCYLATTNSYYLNTDGAVAVGSKGTSATVTDTSQPKTLAELSTIAETLGAAYQNSCGGAVFTYQTAATHTWGDWADNTATFTETGVETRTCTVCGDKETRATVATGVATTKDAIDAIGEVTLESKAFIDVARNFYDRLTEAQKAEVDNYDTLVAAEETYAVLKAEADQAAADAATVAGVEAAIDAIGKVTLDSKDEIDAARAAYNALDLELRAEVDNLDTLVAAEKEYAELKAAADKAAADKAAADEAAAALVETAIGTVTLDSGKYLQTVRDAYDALTADQKALVDNYEILTKAEATYADLAAATTSPKTADFTTYAGAYVVVILAACFVVFFLLRRKMQAAK